MRLTWDEIVMNITQLSAASVCKALRKRCKMIMQRGRICICELDCILMSKHCDNLQNIREFTPIHSSLDQQLKRCKYVYASNVNKCGALYQRIIETEMG